jgi:hypothetical protein
MISQSSKSCGVAPLRQRNSATFTASSATCTATTQQPISLKALAGKVLERNIDRNLPATEHKTGRNFSSEKEGKVVPVSEVANTPAPCRNCKRLEVINIMGLDIPGCLYDAPGEYSESWKRLPIDLKKCIIH